MNKPKISVIIPIYNAEKYLKYCINSILSQSFKDFELLLIDDGSKDRSPSICDEFTTIDKRVHVYHQKNSGVCVTRNNGIEYAQGEYITFCDQDDWLDKNSLSTLYDLAIKNNSDIVCGSIKQVWPHCNIKELLSSNTYVSKINGKDLIELNKVGASIWGKLYKKELLLKNNIRLRNVTTREDYIFYYDLLAECKTVTTTSKIVYYYNKLESDTGCNNPKLDYCECSALDYKQQMKALNAWSSDENAIDMLDKEITSYHIMDIINEYLSFGLSNLLIQKFTTITSTFNNIDYALLKHESIRVLGNDYSDYVKKSNIVGLIDEYHNKKQAKYIEMKANIANIIKGICYKIKANKYKD